MVHIVDSKIYGSIWGTDEMRDIFDENSKIQSWLDIIAVLAEAQAELGIIPSDAAPEIKKVCKLEVIDIAAVENGYTASGHSMLGLIRELKRHCNQAGGEWIYYGATVQDVTDTWLSLALLKAWEIIYRDLRELEEILTNMSEQYAETVMAGRTHGQQGLPVTFGFKVAVWVSEIRRHIQRLKSLRERLGEGQLSGGVGTLSPFGQLGFTLQERFCAKLGLRVPVISWLTARDNLVEFANLLSLIGNTIDKIGHEVYNLQRSEIGEVQEGFTDGVVGSITMPHKRNPELAEHLCALARIIRHHASGLSENMVHEHERDGRSWKAEWALVPPMFVMMGALLNLCKRMCATLEINSERMRENLEANRGLIFSESIMIALAKKIGKQSAHEVVYRAGMRAAGENRPFKITVLEDKIIGKHFTANELDLLMDIKQSVGSSCEFVKRVAQHVRRAREQDLV